MANVYDVAVVGAGPAGGSASMHAAKAGLKTIVLEEHPQIGNPVHCGECLSDLALQRLEIKPPARAIAKEARGIRIIFPDRSESRLNEKGYVLEKHEFEKWLASEAEKNGAEISLNTRMLDLKRQNGYWELDCGEKKINAKIVIDASGVASIISKRLNINQSFKTVSGMQYEMLDVKTDGYIDFYMWPKLAPHGYLWMIPKNDGRANVGLVTDEKTKTRGYLEEFIKEPEFNGKKIVKIFGGTIPASGPLNKTHGEGLMLIGDAAGFTSPMFEGGSHLSLMSGRMAANVAAEAIAENNLSEQKFSKYESMWKNEFPPYSKIVKGKDDFYSFSDEEMNVLAKHLPKDFNNFTVIDKMKVGLRLLMSKPSMIRRELFGAAQAFGYSQAKFYGW